VGGGRERERLRNLIVDCVLCVSDGYYYLGYLRIIGDSVGSR
jgi:hypothetical protein